MKKAPQKTQSQPKQAAAAGGKPRVRITDTTLRDAHQSLWATRMRTDDILAIAEQVDNAGYYSLECWGGATFDVCLRFLRENPWERLRRLKAVCRKTPLQMLLRGQNILGYRNYPDDVLNRFIALACANGMDIFRIFDALNDTRNLEHAIATVKKNSAHAQGTICYTVSPVHTVANYVAIAKTQQAMGIDSLCIKDMAGILSPAAATDLIGALVKETGLPVQVHSHMTSGMAVATYYEAVRAGAGAVDCCVATMSGFSSQPAVETLAEIFESAGYDTGLNLDAVDAENTHFRKLKPSREPSHAAIEVVDVDVLLHHVPGGMISNLRSQLQQQDALDRLPEVLEELPRTRKDMGYPPLVTPTSQIVGVQAVLNVLGGERYGMVTQEARDYVRGLYGRPPAPMDPKLAKQILNGEKPVTVRPADLLQPMLPQAAKDLDPKLIQAEEDILSYCLFPEVALGYFKWRALPEGERPAIPADTEGKPKAAPKPAEAPAAPPAAHDGDTLRHAEIGRLMASLFARLAVAVGSGTAVETLAPAVATAAPAPAPTPTPAPAAPTGPTINAPLTGTFYRTSAPGKPNLADEGAALDAGAPVCIIEAMKLMNPIKAEKKCRLVAFLANHGDAVVKGQPLARIEWA